MAASPDQLTHDIAATRERMGGTMDQVQERVDPRQAWERRQPKVRSKMSELKETVMGTAEMRSGDGSSSGPGMADRLSEGAQGNPLAAGLVAFGAGLLAGSIMPSSKAERRVAADVQQRVEEPVVNALTESGQEIRERVSDEAHQAVGHTKDAASDAAHEVTDTASESAERVKGEAAQAAQDVRRDVEGR